MSVDAWLTSVTAEPATAPAAEAEKAEVETEETADAETESVDTKGEESAPPAEKQATDDDHSPKSGLTKALVSERQKRQEAETKLKKLESDLEQLRSPQQEKPKPAERDIEAEYFANPVKFIEGIQHQARFDASLAVAEDRYPDSEVRLQQFSELVKGNPALYQEFMASRSPAIFAIKKAIEHEKQSEITADPDAYRAKLRAEILAEIAAENGDETPAPQKLKKAPPTPPPSLSAVRSAGGNNAPAVFTGPTPMKDILAPKKAG